MSEKTKIDKIRPAWVIMRVSEILSEKPPHISLLCGPITESNFLKPKTYFQMPVFTKGFDDVSQGDVVKLVYFTTKSQLDDFLAKKSAGFIDIGLRYYRLGSDGWEMIYEDWSENPPRGMTDADSRL